MATAFSKLFSGFGPCRRTVITLLLVNAGISATVWLMAMVSTLAGWSMSWTSRMLSLPASWSAVGHAPWTPVTYMFTHYSPLHLIFNMLWLYWFARLIKGLTPTRLLTLYVGGGLTGALAFLLWHTSPSPLCGASASVLALMTAAAILDPDRRLGLFLLGEVKLKWIAVGAIALTVLGGDLRSGVLSAHLGGAVFGIAAALCFKYFHLNAVKKDRKRHGRKMARAAAMRLGDPDRLDQLLDRIRLSGYESLSRQERRELEEISARLRRADKNSKQ